MEIVIMKRVLFSFLVAMAVGLGGLAFYPRAGDSQALAQPAPAANAEASCCPDCPDCPCPYCPDCPDCCSNCPMTPNVADTASQSDCCGHAKATIAQHSRN